MDTNTLLIVVLVVLLLGGGGFYYRRARLTRQGRRGTRSPTRTLGADAEDRIACIRLLCRRVCRIAHQ